MLRRAPRLARPRQLRVRFATFGVPALRRPEDCSLVAQAATKRCEHLVERVASMQHQPSAESLLLLDGVSATMCGALDVLELARNVHWDDGFREAADNAYDAFASRVVEFNTDDRLYASVISALSDSKTVESLSEEHLRFGMAMRAEFEHDGAHLPSVDRGRLRALQTAESRLAHQFAGASGRQVDDKLRLLEQLLSTRHSIATALGHDSYAKHALGHDRMESCPDSVGAALRSLSERVRPDAAAEMARLRGSKMQQKKSTDVSASEVAAMMAQCSGAHDNELSQYFELESSLHGLQLLLSEAFGLGLEPHAAADGELWHPSVRKYVLRRQRDATLLGVLYLDLFARPGKAGHPALYTIRGGFENPAAWRLEGVESSLSDSVSDEQLLLRHLPAAALVCDLPQPGGHGSEPRCGKALLRHKHVQTLHHEMGHALHALVSRTRCQHFSGTRVALDFAETPSLLMERFANDPRVLSRWATHHASGEPLPAPLAQAVNESTQTFIGLQTQLQCLHALVDLELHGTAQAHSPTESSRLVRSLTRAHTLLPVADASGAQDQWHASFRHLATYGTGYYTYLWADSMSRRIWHQHFECNPFNRKAGEEWLESVLRYGGARHPRQLLEPMLRGPTSPDAATTRNRVGAALHDLVPFST